MQLRQVMSEVLSAPLPLPVILSDEGSGYSKEKNPWEILASGDEFTSAPVAAQSSQRYLAKCIAW
jgi:hypothetical protein